MAQNNNEYKNAYKKLNEALYSELSKVGTTEKLIDDFTNAIVESYHASKLSFWKIAILISHYKSLLSEEENTSENKRLIRNFETLEIKLNNTFSNYCVSLKKLTRIRAIFDKQILNLLDKDKKFIKTVSALDISKEEMAELVDNLSKK